jgi:hypothetical protein
MGKSAPLGPKTELGAALRRYRSAFMTVVLLSTVLNILLLAGSIYMMMVYDSVLPSHSLPTLAALFMMVTGAYLFQGGFDHMRARILGDVGAAFDRQLSRRVQDAISSASLRGSRMPGDGLGGSLQIEREAVPAVALLHRAPVGTGSVPADDHGDHRSGGLGAVRKGPRLDHLEP